MPKFAVLAGLVWISAGSFFILLTFGFASMVDPAIEGGSRHAEILSQLGDNLTPVGFGLLMIIVGIGFVFSKSEPLD